MRTLHCKSIENNNMPRDSQIGEGGVREGERER